MPKKKLHNINQKKLNLQKRKEQMNKLQNRPAPGQPQVPASNEQILMQVNSKIAEQQSSYANNYLSAFFSASLRLLDKGISVDEALKQGYDYAEKYRAKVQEYEDFLLKNAPVAPGLLETQAQLIEAIHVEQAEAKEAKEAESKIIKP